MADLEKDVVGSKYLNEEKSVCFSDKRPLELLAKLQNGGLFKLNIWFGLLHKTVYFPWNEMKTVLFIFC